MSLVNKTILGTAQFGSGYGILNKWGAVSKQEVSRILAFSKSEGISWIDTAVSYGFAQELLGELGVREFEIITKIPPMPIDLRRTRNWVDNHLEASFRALKVHRLAGVLLHNPSDLLTPEGEILMSRLLDYKCQGLIGQIGISVYDIQLAATIAREYNIDVIQVPVNIFDQRALESDEIFYLHSRGIDLHARSIFLQGLLLAERGALPPYFSRWRLIFDHFHKKLVEFELTPLEACLNFAYTNSSFSKVIVGVDSCEQLVGIANYIKGLDHSASVFDWKSFSCLDESLVDPRRW